MWLAVRAVKPFLKCTSNCKKLWTRLYYYDAGHVWRPCQVRNSKLSGNSLASICCSWASRLASLLKGLLLNKTVYFFLFSVRPNSYRLQCKPGLIWFVCFWFQFVRMHIQLAIFDQIELTDQIIKQDTSHVTKAYWDVAECTCCRRWSDYLR